jgi:hypothetical protein
MRKAIEDFAHSMIPEGLTQSRYPCADPQVIPTYSLFWVSMIHDYWMHRRDDAFIRQHQEGIRDILAWFEARRRADGLMGKAEWWNFVDWSWPWEEVTRVGGVPPGVFEGGSSILSLQYAYTLRQAADLFAYWGDQAAAQQYRKTAETICAAVYNRCWDPARQLLADTPDLQSYSQHAHILGILTDAVPAKDQPALLRRIMADTSLTQATFYFQFYLFEAMKKTGQGDLFLPALAPWHEMIGMGLTTFAEKPEPTRSDCHAWSAAPVYELLSTVLGVSPAAPGFTKVQITPYPGTLSRMAGTVAHPDGMIAVQLRQTDGRLTGNVILPGSLTGKLTWKGKSVTLVAGQQEINL